MVAMTKKKLGRLGQMLEKKSERFHRKPAPLLHPTNANLLLTVADMASAHSTGAPTLLWPSLATRHYFDQTSTRLHCKVVGKEQD